MMQENMNIKFTTVHFKIYLEVELGVNVKKKVLQKKVLQFNGMIRTKVPTDDADEVV
jgi:hypothetical protein